MRRARFLCSLLVFAAMTAIFAKLGIQGVNADFATLIRTLIIVLVLAMVVEATPLKTQDWWVGSVGAGLLVGALRGVKDMLPGGWMAPWPA